MNKAGTSGQESSDPTHMLCCILYQNKGLTKLALTRTVSTQNKDISISIQYNTESG